CIESQHLSGAHSPHDLRPAHGRCTTPKLRRSIRSTRSTRRGESLFARTHIQSDRATRDRIWRIGISIAVEAGDGLCPLPMTTLRSTIEDLAAQFAANVIG